MSDYARAELRPPRSLNCNGFNFQTARLQMQPRAPAARSARGLQGKFLALHKRGRRESRMRAAPAVSCAKLCKNTHTSIQVQRRQSDFPCAMVLTVYGALSPVIGLV